MTAHGQDGSKVDAIAKFGKKKLQALDQQTFADILAEVCVHSKADYARLTNRFRLYIGIGMYGPSIARA
jgi:hypothetical protein